MSRSRSRFVQLLRYIRTKGLTQADFARSLGVSEAVLSQWLSGARRPSLRNALQIEAATGGAVPARSWLTAPRRA